MIKCSVGEICRNLAWICKSGNRIEQALLMNRKQQKYRFATVTWQHDNDSDLHLYRLSFGIYLNFFYPSDVKYAFVSQAPVNLAENMKNCVVMRCKLN